ncbi:hypothetical protein BD779DRAFT_1483476 [Infundibulicybe gibba]|nr:hypothetical protein BD779DRAFT_1483476 [Infundibulicybe gibba]
MLFNFRRTETPWEVVDSKAIEPVPMYYDDDDLDIVAIGETDTRGTYTFDVKHRSSQRRECQEAVIFSRQQLMQEILKKGYNTLLVESWRITLFRRVKHYRVEVQYNGRPARVMGKLPTQRPPFMAVLEFETCH